jgi:hypothetical protein
MAGLLGGGFAAAMNRGSSVLTAWLESFKAIANVTLNVASPQAAADKINAALAAGAVGFFNDLGAPLATNHCYGIEGASVVNGVGFLKLRNPWGIDGPGSTDGVNDGLLTVSFADVVAAMAMPVVFMATR